MPRRLARSSRLLAAIPLISVSLLSTGSATACPNCKEAVSAQPEEVSRMASGYNWSICLMLAVPLGLLGTGTFLVRRAVRNGTMPEL
ncbi:hypothetical protein [Aquisphaera insulae]|uniref:hypothetical protein n=1 Tax=Aquisphaera insulae TaxID=2712864 RepID=UPI0013EAF620|nr:hypothetical protein [Aquisphaera insulae]